MNANNTYELLEEIKKVGKHGDEFWFARELQHALNYSKWENFARVIDRAKIACEDSGISVENHFPDVRKMVGIGSSTQREIKDIALSRYACYLLVQNGDPKKEVIAQAQTYFAIKTRQQEIQEDIESGNEEHKRLAIRKELTAHNVSLAEAASHAGINKPIDYAIFQNEGYKGLYGGLTSKEIAQKKNLSKSAQILDHMGSTELAANLFRATQTDEKIRREHITEKQEANKTHFEVGKTVRKTIADLGGTMPEDLSTPTKSIKQLKKLQPNLKLKSNDDNTI